MEHMKCDGQFNGLYHSLHSGVLHVIILNVILLNANRLNVILLTAYDGIGYNYAVYYSADRNSAECRYLIVILLNVIPLNVTA
jgi:hypothetical protein